MRIHELRLQHCQVLAFLGIFQAENTNEIFAPFLKCKNECYRNKVVDDAHPVFSHIEKNVPWTCPLIELTQLGVQCLSSLSSIEKCSRLVEVTHSLQCVHLNSLQCLYETSFTDILGKTDKWQTELGFARWHFLIYNSLRIEIRNLTHLLRHPFVHFLYLSSLSQSRTMPHF